MAIGANWKEIWGPVWGQVWTQTAPEPQPEPEVTAPTPAGKSRRRHFVEIDRQLFEVASVSEAVELLNRARAIAERQAEEKAKKAERALKRKPKVPAVKIQVPEIRVAPAIQADVAPLIADIERLYRKAAMETELRLLLAKQLEDDEEEELLFLL